MTRATGSILLILGLVAATGLVYWALPTDEDAAGVDLDGGDSLADGGREAPSADEREDADQAAPKRPLARDGVPRVLPPDAAIEDVRDALALTDADARTRAAQDAYDAIARIANDSTGVAEGLQRYVLRVEDGIARGIVLAALGTNRDAGNLAWLAGRLGGGASSAERQGAFLGLTRGDHTPAAPCGTLAGIKHPLGPLPTSGAVLTSVAGWLDRATAAEASDAIIPLLHAVKLNVDVAALLVVDDKRPCKLYADLDTRSRELLRARALGHAALPGAVRRVLENAK